MAVSVTRTSKGLSEDQFQKQLEAHKQALQKRVASLPEGGRNRTLFLKQVETAEQDLRKANSQLSNQTYRAQFVFRGVENQFQDVKQVLLTYPDGKPDTWKEDSVLIGSQKNGKTWTYLHRGMNREVTVDLNRWGIDHIFEFGRLRGARATLMTAVLLIGTDMKVSRDYQFNTDVLQKLVQLNREWQKTSPDRGIRFVGTTRLEGADVSIVQASWASGPQASQSLGKLKVWIDPARGYICPRIEEHSGEGLAHLYVSKEYFLDQNSGLWWPHIHTDTEYSPTGEVQAETTYEMTPSATALNPPVDSKEFALSVKKGVAILDRRNGKAVAYRAENDMNLELNKGEIDLGGINLLKQVPLHQPRVISALASDSWRPYLVVVSLFLIFVFSFLLYWRHGKRATA